MTLVVEDGRIVSGANSFATVEDATAYLALRGITTAWTGNSTEDQEAALVRAADYLKDETLFQYRGSRVAWDQAMPWPRVGASVFRGPAIPNNVVPQALPDAQCELCYKALTTDLHPDLERGGQIASERVSVITISYFEKANPRTLITAVMGILQPYLVQSGIAGLVPQVYQTDAESLGTEFPFTPGQFEYPNNPPVNPLTGP